jgi:hypothetical protein
MKKIPPTLLRSAYRKEAWQNAQSILLAMKNILPITEVHLLGSFTTKKKRPADVDFILLLKTKKRRKTQWSLDVVVAPDSRHGQLVLDDAKKWMKQKYGAKKSMVLRLA